MDESPEPNGSVLMPSLAGAGLSLAVRTGFSLERAGLSVVRAAFSVERATRSLVRAGFSEARVGAGRTAVASRPPDSRAGAAALELALALRLVRGSDALCSLDDGAARRAPPPGLAGPRPTLPGTSVSQNGHIIHRGSRGFSQPVQLCRSLVVQTGHER